MRLFATVLTSTMFVFAGSARADEPCPAGTEPKDGVCAPKIEINCPAGTIFEAGKGCVAKVVECPAGMIVEANKCVAKPAPPPPPPPAPEPKPEPAKPEPPKRLFLGLRVGAALPLFNAYRSPRDESAVRLGDEVHAALPVGLDLGYFVFDRLYLGAVASFGPVFVRKASDGYCSPSATTCNGDQLRIAFQARYHLMPRQTFDPWLGLAFGYERLALREEGTLATGETGGVTTTLSGVEFFELSAGGDFSVLPDLRVGPFLSFSLGQYGRASIKETSGSVTGTSDDTVRNTSPHGWLVLGVRGALGLL